MARAIAYNRDNALDAAMALFWQKGFHATSLKDLEMKLNMKPGSIYAAFSSKENLYLLSLDRYFEKNRQNYRKMMAESKSPLQGLADHFRIYARLEPDNFSRKICMITKTLVDTRTTDPAIVAKSEEYMEAMQQEFCASFKQAISRGEIPNTADPKRLARRYQANITALRIELTRGAPEHGLLDLAEDMALEVERLRHSPDEGPNPIGK